MQTQAIGSYEIVYCPSPEDCLRLALLEQRAVLSGIRVEQARLDSKIPHRVETRCIRTGKLLQREPVIPLESPQSR